MIGFTHLEHDTDFFDINYCFSGIYQVEKKSNNEISIFCRILLKNLSENKNCCLIYPLSEDGSER